MLVEYYFVLASLDDHQVASSVILVCRTRTIVNFGRLIEQAWPICSRWDLLGLCIFEDHLTLISCLPVAVDLYMEYVFVSVIYFGGMSFYPRGYPPRLMITMWCRE